MPSPEIILAASAAIANEWRTLAVAWHALFGTLLVGLALGWRPSRRLAGYLLVVPLISVSALAWESGNPFNGSVFAILALVFAWLANRLTPDPIRIASGFPLVAGGTLVAFGWSYPHFLHTSTWAMYAVAAPLGLLPCPTLSALIGLTLTLSLFRSPTWGATLAAAGLLYGAVGVFSLGVALDYGLLGGAALLIAVTAAAAVSGRSVRPGRTDRTRQLPGDDLIEAPLATLTHAITIRCSRRDVWPWLAQMGARPRAGWYSYDVIDNGRQPSADRIIPELQELHPGMTFPWLPDATDGFTLLSFEPEHHLILGGISKATLFVTRAFVLEDLEPGRTRLIVRARGGRGYQFQGLPQWLGTPLVRFVHFVMERRQLLGIAARAERHAGTPFVQPAGVSAQRREAA